MAGAKAELTRVRGSKFYPDISGVGELRNLRNPSGVVDDRTEAVIKLQLSYPFNTGLEAFRGVKRRQELRLAGGPVTVIEDFGHHPTALAETLRSFRARFPATRLTAVFEPRSNTARTRVLQPAFIEALEPTHCLRLPDERYDHWREEDLDHVAMR